MEELTLKELLYLIGGIVAVWGFVEKVIKPFKSINDSLLTIKQQNADKQRDIDDIKSVVDGLKEDVNKQGDMIYQMLDHMATNNNTGQMKRCLDAYNEYNRHN